MILAANHVAISKKSIDAFIKLQMGGNCDLVANGSRNYVCVCARVFTAEWNMLMVGSAFDINILTQVLVSTFKAGGDVIVRYESNTTWIRVVADDRGSFYGNNLPTFSLTSQAWWCAVLQTNMTMSSLVTFLVTGSESDITPSRCGGTP